MPAPGPRCHSSGPCGRPSTGVTSCSPRRSGSCSAGSRYRLLETVRHYGLEKLGEAAEEDVVRSRHDQYFLDLAEQAEREINTPQRGRWLDRLEAEHDNLRAVLAAAAP